MNANQKVQDVLKSMDSMHRAELSPFSKAKIINQLFQEEEYLILPFRRSLFIASFALLLLAVNLIIYFKSNVLSFAETKSTDSRFEELSKAYHLNSTTINYNNEQQ